MENSVEHSKSKHPVLACGAGANKQVIAQRIMRSRQSHADLQTTIISVVALGATVVVGLAGFTV